MAELATSWIRSLARGTWLRRTTSLHRHVSVSVCLCQSQTLPQGKQAAKITLAGGLHFWP